MDETRAEHSVIMQRTQVLSILDGRKDVTRRVVPTNGKPDRWARVKPGDGLWVREAHQIVETCKWPKQPYMVCDVPCKRVEGPVELDATWRAFCFYKAAHWSTDPRGWTSPIFLPRWACRIELTVVSIEQEPLWDIHGANRAGREEPEREFAREGIPSMHLFRDGWSKINPMHPWDTNPLVWRIEYKASKFAATVPE